MPPTDPTTPPPTDPETGGASSATPSDASPGGFCRGGSRGGGSRTSDSRSGRRAGLIAAGLFLLVALPIILTGFNQGRASWDSRQYHEPAVRLFAEQLPTPDLTDYASATTPLYHLLLAVPVRLGLDSTTALRLISAGISAALFFTFASMLARHCPGPRATLMAVVLTLPLIASNYSLLPGAFLLPDNLAWLLVLVLLLRAQSGHSGRVTLASCAVSGGLLALLVATRQIHLWLAGPLVIAAFLSTDPQITKPLWRELRARLTPTAAMGLWCVPAALVVAYFAVLWGGLTPPRFQVTTQSFSPSLPAFLLLEIAVLSVFFVPWLWPVWRGMSRASRSRTLLVGGVLGLALAILPETAWSFAEGRASGWWNLARIMPVIGGHTSVVLLLGAPVGAICLGVWGAGVSRRNRALLGVSLLAFAAAQTASANVWQRYHEPLLLMLMAMAATEITGRYESRSALGNRARLLAPVALSLFLALFTARALIEGDRDPSKQAPDVFGEITASTTNDLPDLQTPENPAPDDPERVIEP